MLLYPRELLVLSLEELHVLPDSLLLVRVAKQVGGMERGQNGNPLIAMKSPAQF